MQLLRALIREPDARVLATLAAGSRPLGLRELARATGYAPDTTARVIRRLLKHGVISEQQQVQTRLFRVSDTVDRNLIPMELACPVPLPREIRIVGASILRSYRLQRTVQPFTIALTTQRHLVPPSYPRPLVLFEYPRPLQFKELRTEDLILALLEVAPKAALRLARTEWILWRRLRRRIHEEGRLEVALKAGVAQLAWASTPWRIRGQQS